MGSCKKPPQGEKVAELIIKAVLAGSALITSIAALIQSLKDG